VFLETRNKIKFPVLCLSICCRTEESSAYISWISKAFKTLNMDLLIAPATDLLNDVKQVCFHFSIL